MCGIAGILRIIKPGAADMPPEGALRAASGEWVWHGDSIDAREVPRAQGGGRGGSQWLIEDAWLDALDERIAWRGPDGAGRFRDRVIKRDGTIVEVALVHRRLSIIDIAGGAQPMVVEDCPACRLIAERVGSVAQDERDLVAAVFNGCVYNHASVRTEHARLGHQWMTARSDTETLLHAHREFVARTVEMDKRAVVPRVLPDGMRASAVWDRAMASLYTSRDHFGEKPLYCARDEDAGLMVFASSAGAVDSAWRMMRHDSAGSSSAGLAPFVRDVQRDEHGRERKDQVSADVVAALAEYLYLGFNHRRVPLPSIENDRGWTDWTALLTPPAEEKRRFLGCLAGTVITVLMIGFLVALIMANQYLFSLIPGSVVALMAAKFIAWKYIKETLQDRPGSAHTALRKQTVEQALQASVLARLDADVPLGCFLSGGIDSSLIASFAREALGPVLETYSMRMPDRAYDESPHAEEVARVLGSRHTTFDCDPESAADDLVHLIRLYGLPFGDSSLLPMYWLCRGTREHVKVALSGDGGDELFHGYQRHLAQRYLRFWSRPFVRMVPTMDLDLRDPTSRDSKKYRLIQAARHGGYTDILAVFPMADLAELIGWRRARGAQPPMRSSPAEFDRHVYLEGDLLRKTDLASMAVGLEVRCPFLDNGVVAAANALPRRHHTAGGVTKAVLRDIARRRGLPEGIVNRPKQGFAIPISDWFRTDFGGLRTLMLDHLSGERPFGHLHDLMEFNTGYIKRIIDEHWAAGGLAPMFTTREVRARDHGQRLFVLTSLAIWSREP